MIENELDVIQRSKKDPKAFQPLYDAYFDQIFIFVHRRVGDKDIAADLTSQTFLKALTKIDKYKDMGYPFSAWLYKIALNEVRYHYRKQSKTMEYYADDAVTYNIEEVFEETCNEELLERITESLHAFGDSAVRLIEMRFFEQKSFRDISFILGISEANAKMRTYRLLGKIKEQVHAKI